jgi:hypothetical protein
MQVLLSNPEVKPQDQEDYKTFLFSYQYNGAEWNYEIKAKNQQEAEERISRIQYAYFNGEIRNQFNVTAPRWAKNTFVYFFSRLFNRRSL